VRVKTVWRKDDVRIGLVGFFGWGNYGDELLRRVWEQALGPSYDAAPVHDLLQEPYFSRSADTVAKEHDALVIGGGDLVIPNKISPLYWNRAWLQRPVVIAGIGVPTWIRQRVPSVMERMQDFFQHRNVRYISARDEESAEWIRRELRPRAPVHVRADLVFSLMMPRAHPYARPTVGINMRTHSAGSDPAELVATVRALQEQGVDVVMLVLGTGQTRAKDLEVSEGFPVDLPILESESLDELSAYIGGLDLLLSNKYHGTVVASMYGVPSIVLSSTAKSRNLYRRLDRLPLLSSNEDPQMLDKVGMSRMPVSRIAVDVLRNEAALCVREVRDVIDSVL